MNKNIAPNTNALPPAPAQSQIGGSTQVQQPGYRLPENNTLQHDGID